MQVRPRIPSDARRSNVLVVYTHAVGIREGREEGMWEMKRGDALTFPAPSDREGIRRSKRAELQPKR